MALTVIAFFVGKKDSNKQQIQIEEHI